ncbi:MAG: hypothetical protein KDA64_13145 [Rhodospirillaceae bacterium]|nr:hypothetical protein [Rhodospirillaceae bacterium]
MTEATVDLRRVGELLEQARTLAIEYKQITKKPLGIAGEYGEYVAAKLLNLRLLEARTAGHDAIDADGRKVQIKARVLNPGTPRNVQRMGRIRWLHEWDSVVLVLLDEAYEPQAIYEANRSAVVEALTRPGSKARNERGALAIGQFKRIGRLRWQAPEEAERPGS